MQLDWHVCSFCVFLPEPNILLYVLCFGNNICKSKVMVTLVHLIELAQATSMAPIEPDLVDKAVADFYEM